MLGAAVKGNSAKNWKTRSVSQAWKIYLKIYPSIKTYPKICPTRKTFDLIGNWLIFHKDNQSGLDDQKHDISDCFVSELRQLIISMTQNNIDKSMNWQ